MLNINYTFELNFDKNIYLVDNPIELVKNTKYIDKFYFNVISDKSIRSLEIVFKGYNNNIIQKMILKKDIEENKYTAFLNIDERFTKFVLDTYIYFNLFDIKDKLIERSESIPISIINSIKIDSCGNQIGLIDHKELINRDAPDQHHSSSIVGFKEETVEEDLEVLYNDLQLLENNTNAELERIEKESKERDKELTDNLDNFKEQINSDLEKETAERIKADKELEDKINTNQEYNNIQIQSLQNKDTELEELLDKEIKDRIEEDIKLNQKIDYLDKDLNNTLNTNINLINNNIDNLNDDLQKERLEREKADNLLELNKINNSDLGNTVAPLGKENIIPKRFIPAELFKSFKYYETIEDRDKDLSTIEDDWCYVNETSKFYVFKNNSWLTISLLEVIVNAINVQFNNTNTTINSTNVQSALIEIKNYAISIEDSNKVFYDFIIKQIEKLNQTLNDKLELLQNNINNDLTDIVNKLESINNNIDDNYYTKPETDNKLDNLQNNINNDLTNIINTLENLTSNINIDYYTKPETDNKLDNLQNNINNDLTNITNQLENINNDINNVYTKPEIDDKLDTFQNVLNNDLTNIVNESQEFAKAIKIKQNIIPAKEFIINLTTYLEEFITEVAGGSGLVNIQQVTELINDFINNHNQDIASHPYLLQLINDIKNELIKIKNDFDNHIFDVNAHNNIVNNIVNYLNKIAEELYIYIDKNDNSIEELKKRILKLETDTLSIVNTDIDSKIEIHNTNSTSHQDIRNQLTNLNQKVTDVDNKLDVHNTSATSHQDIRNQLIDLNQKVTDLDPKIFITNEKTIPDFINNNSLLAVQIKNGNLVYLTNANNQIEIYKFFSTSAIIESSDKGITEGWDNPENYVLLQAEINIKTASTTNLGIVGIGNNLNIDGNGYIYINDASKTNKGLVQIGNINDIENEVDTKVVTAKTIKDYIESTKIIKKVEKANGPQVNPNFDTITGVLKISTNPVYEARTVITSSTILYDKAPPTCKAVVDYVENTVPMASETSAGKIRIATTTEVNAGADNTTAITPNKLQNKLNNYATINQLNNYVTNSNIQSTIQNLINAGSVSMVKSVQRGIIPWEAASQSSVGGAGTYAYYDIKLNPTIRSNKSIILLDGAVGLDLKNQLIIPYVTNFLSDEIRVVAYLGAGGIIILPKYYSTSYQVIEYY